MMGTPLFNKIVYKVDAALANEQWKLRRTFSRADYYLIVNQSYTRDFHESKGHFALNHNDEGVFYLYGVRVVFAKYPGFTLTKITKEFGK